MLVGSRLYNILISLRRYLRSIWSRVSLACPMIGSESTCKSCLKMIALVNDCEPALANDLLVVRRHLHHKHANELKAHLQLYVEAMELWVSPITCAQLRDQTLCVESSFLELPLLMLNYRSISAAPTLISHGYLKTSLPQCISWSRGFDWSLW